MGVFFIPPTREKDIVSRFHRGYRKYQFRVVVAVLDSEGGGEFFSRSGYRLAVKSLKLNGIFIGITLDAQLINESVADEWGGASSVDENMNRS